MTESSPEFHAETSRSERCRTGVPGPDYQVGQLASAEISSVGGCSRHAAQVTNDRRGACICCPWRRSIRVMPDRLAEIEDVDRDPTLGSSPAGHRVHRAPCLRLCPVLLGFGVLAPVLGRLLRCGLLSLALCLHPRGRIEASAIVGGLKGASRSAWQKGEVRAGRPLPQGADQPFFRNQLTQFGRRSSATLLARHVRADFWHSGSCRRWGLSWRGPMESARIRAAARIRAGSMCHGGLSCQVVTSARSMAMLMPELSASFWPVLTMVRVWEPSASTGLVHTMPEASRVEA